ncbi:MAG TPA: HEAT repeat domain-containing protein [Candidatus Acidoferrum sp.]|nr:HEAT repeat domain-containing protein [Candidatus Acidoferrum sp.]
MSSLIQKPRLVFIYLLLAALMSAVDVGCRQPTVSRSVSGEQGPFLNDYDTPTAKIRAGFIPCKTQVVLGEPLQTVFTVENLGPTNFEFWFGGDYRGTGRHNRFKIAAADSEGVELPDPIAHPMELGGFLQPVTLKPGQDFTNVIDLTDFRVIDKPGVYRIGCKFAFDEHRIQKRPTNPVVGSTFTLTILERTPERVARVLDELTDRAWTVRGEDLNETLELTARFGRNEAVPWLAQLAGTGPVELRAAALGALSLVPNDASLYVVLVSLKDSNATIRAAAAGSLGAMRMERGVDALLEVLPKENSPVAEAVLLALGTSKADRAFPVITNTLDAGQIELQRAAINALVNFGGSNAITTLTQRINSSYLSLRYEVVLALAEKLHQPMPAEWLLPVLAGREYNTREWLDSLRLLRMYAGDGAIPAMLSCLDFDVAWSGRNWWILETGVKPCPKAPPIDYEYDPNTDGTPDQWQKNLRLLETLKPLAGPIPTLPDHPAFQSVPYLKTDPPIDFAPTFKEIESGGVEIDSGFLRLEFWRTSARMPYSVPGAYRPVYETAAHFRSLPNLPDETRAKWSITLEQMQQLDRLLNKFAVKLCGSRVSDQKVGNLYNLLVQQGDYCPHSDDWHDLFRNYLEAPPTRKEQAKAELIDSVRIFSQNYHAGTVEFAESARKIFTPSQLEEILR